MCLRFLKGLMIDRQEGKQTNGEYTTKYYLEAEFIAPSNVSDW